MFLASGEMLVEYWVTDKILVRQGSVIVRNFKPLKRNKELTETLDAENKQRMKELVEAKLKPFRMTMHELLTSFFQD